MCVYTHIIIYYKIYVVYTMLIFNGNTITFQQIKISLGGWQLKFMLASSLRRI